MAQVALVAVACLCVNAQAADSFVIKDIRIEGLQRVEPGTVFSYLPVQVGDTFTEEKGAEAIKALYSTGFFRDVQIQAQGVAPRCIGHDASPAREQVVASQPSEAVHLVGQQAFNAGGARHE